MMQPVMKDLKSLDECQPPSHTFLATSMAAVERITKEKKRKATNEAKANRKRATYVDTILLTIV